MYSALLLLVTVAAIASAQDSNTICNAQTTCANCIQASPLCSWCTAQGFSGPRCYATLPSNVTCNEVDIQNPRGSVQGTSNESFSDFNQVTPHNVNLTLRRGEPVTFQVRVRPARNYPLDLYLLMDLSYSMRDDLDNLKALGGQIATAIQQITTNYNLGFGAFVDKPIAPYVSIVPDRLRDPCNSGCEGPYSFRHVSSLGNNTSEFSSGIQARRISGNLDAPEGGFDGFLQSIVCQNLIGWRPNARHLLLYITDAGFHYAGDGKLGGAIIPHTGECLMQQQGSAPYVDYRDYATLDYPSVGQIRQNLRQFDIIPLIAATAGARTFYDALGEFLAAEGADVGELASDSSNVVTLIQQSYERISQRVIISPDTMPEVTFEVTPIICPEINGQQCNGLQIEQEALFNITATLAQCSNTPLDVSFRVLGFGSFNVRVESICDCQCVENEIMNSVNCSNNGTLTCGICQCNSGRFGANCQCDNTGLSGDGSNTTMCSVGLNGVCSGQGRCVCGRCICNDDYEGENCECLKCPVDGSGLICGGRGECNCNGVCECNISPLYGSPYEGQNCECEPQIACNNPFNNISCSDNGTCTCGRCNCIPGYSGTHCEICPDCILQLVQCRIYIPCAMCAFNLTNNQDCNAICNNITSNITVTSVSDTEVINAISNNARTTTCDFQVENCEYFFYVTPSQNPSRTQVTLNANFECVPITPAWVIAIIVLAIIVALILIGLLILAAIKIALMILDYYEVKKFMSEVKDPTFRKNENPLFQSPNKEYKNPVYGQ